MKIGYCGVVSLCSLLTYIEWIYMYIYFRKKVSKFRKVHDWSRFLVIHIYILIFRIVNFNFDKCYTWHETRPDVFKKNSPKVRISRYSTFICYWFSYFRIIIKHGKRAFSSRMPFSNSSGALWGFLGPGHYKY